MPGTPLRREKGSNHDGIAFYVHDVKGFATWQAQPFRENAHHGGIPLLTGRMPETLGRCSGRPFWIIGP